MVLLDEYHSRSVYIACVQQMLAKLKVLVIPVIAWYD
jgi:hypothetical protein